MFHKSIVHIADNCPPEFGGMCPRVDKAFLLAWTDYIAGNILIKPLTFAFLKELLHYAVFSAVESQNSDSSARIHAGW